MMNELLVRHFRETDAAEIATLEKRCFSEPWTEAMILESAKSTDFSYFCAFWNGAFAGYLGVTWVPPEAEIANLAVVPEMRRHGIGKSLLAALEDEAAHRAVTDIFLEVRASNSGAQALYACAGYTRVGLRRGFYAAPREDGLIYRKSREETFRG